jgi:hypothetical protein
MLAGLPRRFGLDHRVVLTCPAGLLGGEGVDDLPVGERVTVPAEVRDPVVRGLAHRRANDEAQVRLVQPRSLCADSIPASATTTISDRLCRGWNAVATGRIVAVSAILPGRGWLYLCAVRDGCSSRAIG